MGVVKVPDMSHGTHLTVTINKNHTCHACECGCGQSSRHVTCDPFDCDNKETTHVTHVGVVKVPALAVTVATLHWFIVYTSVTFMSLEKGKVKAKFYFYLWQLALEEM